MGVKGLRLAILGGDEREAEIARLAAGEGAQVAAFGAPVPERGLPGVEAPRSAAEAMRGASYALFPVPGLAEDGSLYAPVAPTPIVPDDALLAELAPGATIILGRADERLRDAAARCGVRLCEYESDAELMQLRAPAIVEGAIGVLIEHSVVTIHGSEIAVIGYGNIGAALARTLTALHARVQVAARNPVQRAAAIAGGAGAVPLEELSDIAPRLAMLISTVPKQAVGATVLERLPEGCVVVDLAAPPGGVDLELASSLGHRAVWARGLGARAPVTVARSQWAGISERIERLEAARQS